MNRNSLTKEQVETILKTEPPKKFPIDLSLLPIVQELKRLERIDRVVIIPDFLIPRPINFWSIQELGIRSLTEEVLLVYVDNDKFFNWTTVLQSQWEVTSTVDFMLVDSRTSGILTSERVFSSKVYKTDIFKKGEADSAKKELLQEQGKKISELVDKLFSEK